MIGYYVHHHGLGHLTRARSVAAASSQPVTVLSSLPAPDDPAPFADWVLLPRDDDPADLSGPYDHDLRAGGALHWAPVAAAGYRDRMAAVAAWVTRTRPSVVVVDVSVEVAATVRLLGVPTVVVAGAGVRTDDPHRLAHRVATRIVAPWPEPVYRAEHLTPYREKTVHVGAFSRFDTLAATPPPGRRRVLVLLGAGGADVDAATMESTVAACTAWEWELTGAARWREDVWARLAACDVVVTHAGMNSLAEVAAARRPAVVVPQSRPFDEQRETARALARAGIAVVADPWPHSDDWPALLERAAALGGCGWQRWNDGGGAARFAAEVATVAAEFADV